MQKLHVGRGAERGALTVFPIWGEYAGPRGYTTAIRHAQLAEQEGGPNVGTLTVGNPADKPMLMLEGQILEGGWQNRMLARSLLVGARSELAVEVVCVEAGRWGGEDRAHRAFNRRASSRVRSGLRNVEDRQGEVWRRVSELDDRLGVNATSSFTEHADRAEDRVRRLTRGLRPFPGQVGVVIGLAGQPVAAEVFDSPTTLVRQFASIVNAAAMDALWLPSVPTPSRRARRLVDHAGELQLRQVAQAGLGVNLGARDDAVEVAALGWRDREVHSVVTNLRHQLVSA
jgi:hypothetical protein